MPLLTAALEDICIEAATAMFDAAGYPMKTYPVKQHKEPEVAS